MSDKVNIVLEYVDQPPIDTRCSISHATIVVESKELADELRLNKNQYLTVRVIAATVEARQDETT